jgi:hypothetical protein
MGCYLDARTEGFGAPKNAVMLPPLGFFESGPETCSDFRFMAGLAQATSTPTPRSSSFNKAKWVATLTPEQKELLQLEIDTGGFGFGAPKNAVMLPPLGFFESGAEICSDFRFMAKAETPDQSSNFNTNPTVKQL